MRLRPVRTLKNRCQGREGRARLLASPPESTDEPLASLHMGQESWQASSNHGRRCKVPPVWRGSPSRAPAALLRAAASTDEHRPTHATGICKAMAMSLASGVWSGEGSAQRHRLDREPLVLRCRHPLLRVLGEMVQEFAHGPLIDESSAWFCCGAASCALSKPELDVCPSN